MGQQRKNTTHDSGGKFTGSRGLTEKQGRFVAAYVANGGQAQAAAEAAGYQAAGSEGWRLMQIPHVQTALHDARQKKLSNLATSGLALIEGIIRGTEEAPVKIRFEASKFVIQLAGHVAPKAGDAQETDEKPMEEWTIEELEAFVRRGEEAAKRAKQPILDAAEIEPIAPEVAPDESEPRRIQGPSTV